MQCSTFKNSCIGRLVLINRYKYIQCAKTCKNVQKRAKPCKNVHLKYLLIKKTCISSSHLSKNVQKRAKTCKNVHLKYLLTKKRASQILICQKTCKNVHLKCFWILFKNVHCQGPCILRPCISRPYCK